MRNVRTRPFHRRTDRPCAYPGGEPRSRRTAPRLWPVRTVLRRVERLIEAEEAQECEDSPYSLFAGGDEPNA